MDFDKVRQRGAEFSAELAETKRRVDADFGWYPYDTMASLVHLDALLSGPHRSVFGEIADGAVADIGGADGDLGFFLERELGCAVDLVDYGPTNFNGLRGARLLAGGLGSSLRVHETDLDAQFSLPREDYAAIFLLGILYHLKNPFYVLEALARHSRLCFLSTRVTQFAPDRRADLREVPAAYLLGPHEANNDPTNFWIFTVPGLRRIADRAGWDVLDLVTVGCTDGSEPGKADLDERAFVLLRSRQR